MNSDEFNNVKVTNEGKPGNFEFTKAQSSEYSSFADNISPIKDELNNRKIINDHVEENILKSTKEKERKREKKEGKSIKGTEATASSTATAVGGTIAGVAASAATAAVVVIGAVAGVSIIQQETPQEDLVTFISSEVGTNDIIFSFSMPANLLYYEEGQEQQSYREVVASIESSDGYYQTFPIPEYEYYDDTTLVFYASADGLAAGTTYALTIDLQEIFYTEVEEEVVNVKQLAFRTFTTLSVAEVITFNQFDITANSVSFSFNAALKDLGVDPQSPTMPNVFATLNEERQTQLSEYDFIDEEHVIVYGEFSQLQPETTYNLNIYLDVDREYKLLGSTTFTTLAKQELIEFNYPFDITYNSVEFSFNAALEDIGVDPQDPTMPSLFASLDNDRYLTLTEYEFIDENNVKIFGGFTQLDPETTYTLDIYLEQNNEQKLLGSTTFTTLEKTSSVVFDTIEVERDYVSFSYTVAKSDVDYEEGVTPAVQYSINNGSDYYDESWAESFEEEDESTLRGFGSFSGLPLGNTFNLTISLSREQEFVELGSTTFDNYSGFRWVIDPTKQVTSTTTFYNFAINPSYIGFISQEETPDVINHISAVVTTTGGEEVGAYRPSAINAYSSTYVTCLGNIDSLNPETEYTLTIYYIDDNQQQEALGSCDFTTTESAGGFKFLNIEPGATFAEISFQINSSEVTEIEEGVYSIQMKISHGATHIDTINVNQWSESDVEGKLIGTVNIQDLPANTEYHVEVYSWTSGGTYGSTDFVTYQTVYNFTITDQTITHDSLDVEFYVDASAFDIDWTDASAVRELEDKIYMEYRTSEGESYQPQYAYNLQRTSSDVAEGQFNITGLTANTKYIATIYYESPNGLIPLSMYDFETGDTPPGINNIASNYEVFEAGDGYFRMPITISYEGDTSTYGNYFILLFTVPGLSEPFTATVPVEEGPQYAKFAERTVSTYLGRTVSYTVVCENDMDTVLYEVDSATFFDTDTSGINSFYGLKDYSNEVQYSGGVVNFSFMPVCAIGNRSLEATIVFTTNNGLEYEYAIDLTYFNAIDNLSIDLLTEKDSGGTSMTYDMLKDGFEGQALNITIRYYTSATTGDIYEVTVVNDYSFMFNFIN